MYYTYIPTYIFIYLSRQRGELTKRHWDDVTIITTRNNSGQYFKYTIRI